MQILDLASPALSQSHLNAAADDPASFRIGKTGRGVVRNEQAGTTANGTGLTQIGLYLTPSTAAGHVQQPRAVGPAQARACCRQPFELSFDVDAAVDWIATGPVVPAAKRILLSR